MLIEYYKNPSPTIKEKLSYILNEINGNVEMFQKSQLENLVKSIQENSNIYEIKSGIKNFNLFPKKLIKSRLVNTFSMPKSDDYNINIDIENNIIVLQDKKLEDNLIVFAELTHSGVQSINFYNSLINTVKPNLIFLEQEPFEIHKTSQSNSERQSFSEYQDKFSHLQEFKNYLKDNKSDRNYTIKGSDFVYNDKKELMEIESIIYGALTKKVKVNLFDLNHEEYLNTLFNNQIINNKENIDFFNEDNKRVISILNNIEISAWINLQLIKGCKNCTSFLSRNEIEWNPLSLEYVVNKRNMPNYESSLLLKTKKIFNKIKDNKNQKYIIFSSDTLNIAKKFIEFSNKNSKEKDYAETFFHSFNQNYTKEFSFKNNDEKYYDIITCSMLMKEKYYIYSFNPPFKIKANGETEFLKEYKKHFLKNFDLFYNLNQIEELNLENEEENNENFLNTNEKPLLKQKDCSPYNYIQSLKNIRESMIKF